jgi:SAM-dependent methyltransferase
MADPAQVDVNVEFWTPGDYIDTYANRTLNPVEVLILVRFREALSGRVLEVGCGAGRILGYLVELAREAHGIDVSPAMVEYCRRTYPEANVRIGDLQQFADPQGEPYDVIFAGANIMDILDDAGRREVLAGMREMLAPEGMLIFNSHNLAYLDGDQPREEVRTQGAARAAELVVKALNRPPAAVARAAARIPRQVRNRRRLQPLQRRADDHAIINDEDLDYGTLHYYIRRDDQVRQLAELGYELVACLDTDGRPVAEGEPGKGSSLHYIARPAT